VKKGGGLIPLHQKKKKKKKKNVKGGKAARGKKRGRKKGRRKKTGEFRKLQPKKKKGGGAGEGGIKKGGGVQTRDSSWGKTSSKGAHWFKPIKTNDKITWLNHMGGQAEKKEKEDQGEVAQFCTNLLHMFEGGEQGGSKIRKGV